MIIILWSPFLDPGYPISQGTQSSTSGNSLHPSKLHLNHAADENMVTWRNDYKGCMSHASS